MSSVTDRYCPHCFLQLNEGIKDWLWCPDTYNCEFECDRSKGDKSLSHVEMVKRKLEKLKERSKRIQADFDIEIELLEVEIKRLTSDG